VGSALWTQSLFCQKSAYRLATLPEFWRVLFRSISVPTPTAEPFRLTFHSPGRPDAAADHAQFPAVVISAGPFGAADVVPSGDTEIGRASCRERVDMVGVAETERRRGGGVRRE